MKRSRVLGALFVLIVITLGALPSAALGFGVTGGAGSQTQNPYGQWFAGKEACAQEGCHSAIVAKKTPHSEMVKDVQANPSALIPAADSGFWPYTSPFGGITLRPRDMYLQLGDDEGFIEYVGPAGSALATKVVPADDLPVWSPMYFLVEENIWEPPTSKLANSVYGQSCSSCHNVGPTRPSNATYVLANGATQTTFTPTTVSEWGVQCEACHGSGKNPDGHKKGVPGVVGGYQVLKAQVCGQCHVNGFTPEKGVSGNAFGNPNGFTTDTTLTAYLSAYSVVETEGAMMRYANGQTSTKPKFLPNGANFSMRHSYYNEWLVNKVPVAAGNEKGHADPLNDTVKATVGAGNSKCLKCHSGLGFLNRIDARGPSGKRIVPTFPSMSVVTTADPGISCQVCHTGHVGMVDGGGYDSLRRKGNGEEVGCGDCHNWQFEMLDQPVQYETLAGVEYSRPARDTKSRHPQREMVSGGHGGEDGSGGLWGVAPMGEFMPDTECQDCHMPRTHKEGMPAGDTGSAGGTRMSHRFHIVEPGDAARWKLRPNGDSCVANCHEGEASAYTREEFQSWIDEKRDTVSAASKDATQALTAAATEYGLASWASFIAAQPGSGAAAGLPAAKWTMLQRSAQNVDFVVNDASGGIHNPDYAMAGLGKALLWARSASATVEATLPATPHDGSGMIMRGKVTGLGDAPIAGAEVSLESSADRGVTWSVVDTATTAANGEFSFATGRIIGEAELRCGFRPADGVSYFSAPVAVAIPVTTGALVPSTAEAGWVDADRVTVLLTPAPPSLTTYSLAGATVRAQSVYSGGFDVTAEGLTTVRYRSANAAGIEAPIDLPVRIDRAAPVVACDAVALYSGRATVRATASDSGAGVAQLETSLDGAPLAASASGWYSCTVTAPGAHTLRVRATDGAGKVSDRTWTFSVKVAPTVAKTPSKSSQRVGYRRTWTTKARVTRDGAPVAGKVVVLQKSSNNRSWRKAATLTTNGAGEVAKSVRFTSRGTTYWRWYVPEDGSYFSASSGSTRVVVK